MPQYSSRPRWVTLWCAAAMLTAFTCPAMIALLPADMALFMLMYPLYAIAGGIIAWRVYPTRPDIFWVLILLVTMTFGLMWLPLLAS